ncbi:hypothetical protein ACF07W_19825 [Streptomyces sp. NPDC015140]|uniref:hypothetical protein n=1 Tax=Streptomyces sp. NPDC015140 TaxID=3364943 RepID=UPI0036F994B2
MSRHLIDDVTVGWDELGTDLLDDAPPALVQALTGGEQWPSRALDHLVTPDGSPLVRMAVTEENADDMDVQWGYVLHPHGIEVFNLLHADRGPVVDWSTDPSTAFSDHPAAWTPARTGPRSTPPRSTPVGSPAKTGTPRPAGRR